jgi:hypothetical protein
MAGDRISRASKRELTMRIPRGEISLGDLVEAYAKVGAEDPGTAEAIAALLGFQLNTEGKIIAEVDPTVGPSMSDQHGKINEDQPREAAPVSPKLGTGLPYYEAEIPKLKYPLFTEARLESEEALIEFEFEHTSAGPTRQLKVEADWPGWYETGEATFAHTPLLPSRWTRGIISEAAATLHEGNIPDISKVLGALARCEELERIPMLKVPTLVRGCQVLCDVSIGMMPFASDSQEILNAIQSVVGRERTEILYFEDCPVYGVETYEESDFVAYQPPPAGTPVLIISDLGIAEIPFSFRRSSPGEWLKLVLLLRTAGCPPVALTPYPSTRWPQPLINSLPVIQWDRHTTAATVRRARKKG